MNLFVRSAGVSDASQHVLHPPASAEWGYFVEWARALPSKGSPAWLGLSVSAEKMLKIRHGTAVLNNLLGLFLQGGQGSKKGKGPAVVKGGKLWLQQLGPKFE